MICNSKKYVFSVILSLIILYAVVALFAYLRINSYNYNRVPNPRAIPAEYRLDLIKRYINKNLTNQNILVLGDSQANGHMHEQNSIFSSIAQSKYNLKIINLAFQDSRVRDNIEIIKYLETKNHKFELVIFNANQSHLKDSDFMHLTKENSRSILEGLIFAQHSFVKLALQPNPEKDPKQELTLYRFKNYFDYSDINMSEYFSKVNLLVDESSKISKRTVVYVTPHSKKAAKYDSSDNIEKLNKFSNSFKIFCSKKRIECLEIDEYFNDDDFIDIVHFNKQGHLKMSELVYQFYLGDKNSNR